MDMNKTATITTVFFGLLVLLLTDVEAKPAIQDANQVHPDSIFIKANEMKFRARRMWSNDQDSAKALMRSATDMALSIPDSNLIMELVRDWAVWMDRLNKPDSAKYYLDMGKRFSKNHQNVNYVNILMGYGDHYSSTKDYDQSLEYFKKAEMASIAIADSTKLPEIYIRIGNLLLVYTYDYELILEYYQKSVDLSKKYSNSMFQYILLYTATVNTIKIYPETHGLLFMEELLTMHHEMYPDLGRDVHHFELAAMLNLEGKSRQENIDRMKEYVKHTEAMNLYKAHTHGLSELAIAYENPDSTIHYLNILLEKSRERNDILYQLVGYSNLVLAYERKNDFRNALAYHRTYVSKNDSLKGLRQQTALAEIRERYESEKKEMEIAQLEEQKILQAALSDKRAMQRNWWIAAFIAVLVLLGSIILFYMMRLKTTSLQASVAEAKVRDMKQQHRIITMNSMIEGQENERKRIAQDLHDGLGGMLTTIKMHFSNIQNEVKQLDDLNIVEKTGLLIDHANTEVRKLAHEMMPGSLVKLGLSEALAELCDQNTVANKLDVHFEAVNMEDRLNETAEIMLYRITQELLNNIQKHSQANDVIVQLADTGVDITLTVEDNGTGFDVESINTEKGMGLKSIRSRAVFLQGDVNVQSEPGVGTTIIIRIPKKANIATPDA